MNKDKLFQFTHPCGCDPHVVATINLIAGFNSRTRVGATVVKVLCSLNRIVSIHAPVWVRPLKNGLRTHSKGFQFTHPCGCDGSQHKGRRYIFRFQFTHPCGCDSVGPSTLTPFSRFNSRTRVGATIHHAGDGEEYLVSIHAPVWVRRSPLCVVTEGTEFQFTHPCGCDVGYSVSY